MFEMSLLSDKAQAAARNRGKIQLWSGRWRHFYDPSAEAHKAMNSLMQGGGADIVERQMVRLYNNVADEHCRMLLQVHDSVVFEIADGLENVYIPKIRAIMEDVDSLLPEGETFGVKFKVDVHEWGS